MILKLVLLMLIVVFEVKSLKTCNKTIIDNILKSNNCPKCALRKLHGLSPFTYPVNAEGTVPARVRCLKGEVDAPIGHGTTGARVTVYYKNTTIPPLIIEYRQQEVSCGHIKEWDKNNAEFQIYALSFKPVFCYYRCTTYDTEGKDFAACAVPLGRQRELLVQAAVRDCKEKLARVGVTARLEDLTTCDLLHN